MTLSINQVHQGDARDLLKEIAPSSVACSIWSPPYHVGKSYEEGVTYEEWVELISEVIAMHYAILIPGGFLAVNIADILAFPDPTLPRIQAVTLNRQSSPVTRDDVLAAKSAYPNYNRDQLAALLGCSEQTIDRRLNGNNIRGGKYVTQTRVQLAGGTIQAAGSDAGLALYDRRVWVKDAAWENSKWHSLSYRSVDEFEYVYILWKPGETVVDRSRLTRQEWIDWGSRGVWTIPSVRANDDHEAKFPVELPRRILKLFTSPGEIVLDCFMGSGTTGIAAIREGRQYIGIELSPAYADMANRACSLEAQRQALLMTGEQNGHRPVATRERTQLPLTVRRDVE